MGQDQDAAGARGLDESERRDGLAGAGRVLEPEALAALGSSGCSSSWTSSSSSSARPASPAAPRPRAPVLGSSSLLVLLAGDRCGRLASSGSTFRRAERSAVGSRLLPLPVALGLGQQRGQRARERVDLMGGEDRAVGEVRLLLGKQALEPEQQRELAPPLDRGLFRARVDLGERSVERSASRGAGGKRVFERLAVVDEAFARESSARAIAAGVGKGVEAPIWIESCVWMCEPRPIRLSGSPGPDRGRNGEETPSEAETPSPHLVRRIASI